MNTSNRFHLLSLTSGSLPTDTTLAVFCFENAKKPAGSFVFGQVVEAALAQARADGFTGGAGQVALAHLKGRPSRFILVGLGAEKEISLESVRRGASAAVRRGQSMGLKTLAFRPPLAGSPRSVAQAAAEGARLGAYRYTKYQSPARDPEKLQTVVLIAKDAPEAKAFKEGIDRGEIFAASTNFARDLINQPPSVTTREILARTARGSLKNPVQVKVFNKRQIEAMGMGALLGVNRGSHQPPYFLHLTYRPKGNVRRRIGICGKGITFDSGGLSLKPAKSMETMKYDMSGAAVVFAVFQALATLKPPVEVHGFTPLTENMPGGNAAKPGDVFKTLRGKTIEVLNTDAEGRLVLSDALSYACRQKLDEVLDVATLTGACIVALGNRIAGILGNDRNLIEKIKNAAALSGEKLWELPLEKEYETLLKSPVADVKNIGPAGEAGTILGGLFLKEFVDPDMPWAHLDIASTAWANAETPLSPAGATGIMVRTLLHYLLSYN